MEVTTANFEDGLARLEALLPTCKFIAFDEEMTGIMLDRSTAPSVGDSPEARYKKMKRVTEECKLPRLVVTCASPEHGFSCLFADPMIEPTRCSQSA